MSTLATIALAVGGTWLLLLGMAAVGYLQRIADALEVRNDYIETERAERDELAARFAEGGDPA